MVQPPAEPELNKVHPYAAGIDIGASEHWVSIPTELDPEPVRKFSCFTADLYAIAEWLKSRGITTVAMESTGVYWIPLFQILETSGLEVRLVNAHFVYGLQGKILWMLVPKLMSNNTNNGCSNTSNNGRRKWASI